MSGLRAPTLALAVLAAGAALATGPTLATLSAAQAQMTTEHAGSTAEHHPYVGMWVTADGRVRHELLPNGRYGEARGSRESAYRGRYEVTGTEIFYWDDTGFTADGVFVDADTLHHGGMILYRRR